MKKLITLALFILSQSLATGAEIKGKIYLEHDTLNVTFRIPLSLFGKKPVLHNLRSKVTYLNNKGQRKVLKAKDAKEIIFKYENETFRMVSKPHPYSLNRKKPRYYFLKLEEEGTPLKLFIFYDETTSDDGMNSVHTDYTEEYFVQKNNGELIQAGGLNFRKTMLGIVGDCPEVAEKVETREWKQRDIKKIISTYNARCSRESR